MVYATKIRVSSVRGLNFGLLLAGALVIIVLAVGPRGVKAGSEADAASAARASYSEKAAKGYSYRYGVEHPFLPSSMETDNGEFIDPKSFPTAQYCGHCHQESHTEWRQSAHSNANRAPWYLRNVNLLNAEKGISSSRHCEGCHDPLAVAAGAITEGAPRKRPYDQDGVTCMVCHSIKSVDTRGTGSFVLAEPAVMVDENGAPLHRPVTDAEILAHLDRHSAAVMKPFYRTSEFCASCHKAALPKTLNDYKWQRAISLYDEWQNSSFARESPLPFYKKDAVSTCQTCHMQREALQGVDYGAKNGKLASHRWLGANTVVPQYYHYDEQTKRVTQFLQANVFNVDIFGLETGEPEANGAGSSRLIAPLGSAPYQVAAGQRVTLSVVIQNKGIAHSHVPEQRDMYESWVDFTVKDAAGKVIAESGAVKPGKDLDPSAHSFTNRLVNKAGTLNELHQVWNNRVVAYNNSIQSGRSQLIRYCFTMPAKGPVTVTATVRYRRFDQRFMDFGMSQPEGQHYIQPVVDMVSQTRTLAAGTNPPSPAAKADNPDWMRWNNYGIALLDAQQYEASVNAFQRVAAMRPDYADAETNVGIAYIQWEKYDEALPSLQRSLTLAKDNARALYYLALVERNRGEVDEAIADLQKVAAQFPRSRDVHRELGFSYYQQHKYTLARAEYETVQTIDPDDLAAHYNLAILYRRLGLKDKAAEQAAYFADQKDDPTASTYALQYLRKHREIAQESVPWHLHDLDKRGRDETDPVLPLVIPTSADASGGGGR
ncbi:MAG: multiheme c-type cytochrome [Acidobacteriaceae bacterium]